MPPSSLHEVLVDLFRSQPVLAVELLSEPFQFQVLTALPEAARAHLEALMATGTYEYKSDFARRYYTQGQTEGRTEGRAEALLAVLNARGITVPDDARTRITGCTDVDQLDAWVRRAVTATCIHDLFVD
jgi:hypothetical protein